MDRPMEDVVTAPRIGKHSGRRMHSDMSGITGRYGAAPTGTVRKSSCFWNTVMDTAPPKRHHSGMQHHPRSRLPPQRPGAVDHRAPHAMHLPPQPPHYYHPVAPPAPEPMAGHRCQECGMMFRNSVDLRSHKQKKHQKVVRPHKCDRCMLGFSQRSHLNQHIRTVHDKHKPFACDQCDKSFGKRFDLTSHSDAVHANERPHSCEICPKKFAKRSNLTRHVEKIHPRHYSPPTQRRRPPL